MNPAELDAPESDHPGARILALAKGLGISQRGLSVKLAELCEVSNTASYKWLMGRSSPSHENAEKIARLLGATPSFILFGEVIGEDASREKRPFQICAIQNLFERGDLDENDLHEIEKFARLLASKNSQIMKA